MGHHVNPAYPNPAAYGMSNVAPASTKKGANVAPAMKTANAGPVGGYGGGCGGFYTTTGVILVLFILLVIISRSWL